HAVRRGAAVDGDTRDLKVEREGVGAIQHEVVAAIRIVRPLVFREVEWIGCAAATEDAAAVVRRRLGERIGYGCVRVFPAILRLCEQGVVARGADILQRENAGEPWIPG